ncbi:hypothetical protein ACFPUZ_11245 [Corynebacterium nasicanis]|uniref:Uncharacterized protein n=1 Tax=Corynebacterium nasicanis TaxID=1448267 RepID=A0ABW1QGI7_9CORY
MKSFFAVATALVGLVACGMPDAQPVVDQMRLQAAEKGFVQRLNYSAVSIGGLGTAPWVRSEVFEADDAEFAALLALLRENQQLNDEIGGASFNVGVFPLLNGTEFDLRDVADAPTGEMLSRLAGPDVERVKYYRTTSSRGLEVSAAPAAYDRVAELVPEMQENGIDLLRAGPTYISLGPTSTPASVAAHLRAVDEVRAVLAPDQVTAVRVGERIDIVEVRTESLEPARYAPLRALLPADTELVVSHPPATSSRAIVGGVSEGRASSEEEAALRAVVEKR